MKATQLVSIGFVALLVLCSVANAERAAKMPINKKAKAIEIGDQSLGIFILRMKNKVRPDVYPIVRTVVVTNSTTGEKSTFRTDFRPAQFGSDLGTFLDSRKKRKNYSGYQVLSFLLPSGTYAITKMDGFGMGKYGATYGGWSVAPGIKFEAESGKMDYLGTLNFSVEKGISDQEALDDGQPHAISKRRAQGGELGIIGIPIVLAADTYKSKKAGFRNGVMRLRLEADFAFATRLLHESYPKFPTARVTDASMSVGELNLLLTPGSTPKEDAADHSGNAITDLKPDSKSDPVPTARKDDSQSDALEDQAQRYRRALEERMEANQP